MAAALGVTAILLLPATRFTLPAAAADGGPGTATTEATSEAPELKIAGSDGLELIVSVEKPDWTPWGDDLQGYLRVTLYNSGSLTAQPLFHLVPSGSDTDCSTVDSAQGFVLEPTAAVPVPPNDIKTYDLRFSSVDPQCVGVAASLLVTADPATDPVATQVKSKRSIGWREFGPPLGVALAAGVAFLVGTLVAYTGRWRDRTPVGDSWSFGGSWLTSISALATALGGVLAAGGFVSELLPGVPLGHFLGLSLTFSILIVAAPLVFSICQVTDWEITDAPAANGQPAKQVKVPSLRGTLIGLFLGGALTCAGVAGLLTMLAVLTELSSADDVSKSTVTALLVMVLGVAAAYVTVSTRNTVKASGAAPPKPPSADLNDAELAIIPQAFTYKGGFTGSF